MATLSPIPLPPTIPFLGNANLIDVELPVRSFLLLAKQYGEIYQLTFSGGVVIVHINSAAMVRQVSDDAHFKKSVSRGLREVRNLAGDGLFTADSDEPNWGIAHRILMPAFGIANVRNMFPDMQDICSQMLLKWTRFGSSHVFDPSEDYTRLTFDTIALCSMSYRFNSFYERDMPQFTQEMVEFLSVSNRRAFRPAFMKLVPLVYKNEDDKYFEDAKHMTDLAREIIRKRKEESPVEQHGDLLELMLEGRDPKTGEKLSEENIIYNLLTFLIAGHETTSGLLTFATYYLLKNPSCLQKLREELDEVLGSEDPTLEDLGKMPYLTAVMRETLRLSPTAPARSVAPLQDAELIGGDGDPANPSNRRYAVKKDQLVVVHAITSMRDPLVWGDDAESFRPERMLDGKFESLPEQAWQPFGYGMRACIGRAFAWQEAMLVLACVFSQFDLFFEDSGYSLEIKQALTIKPKDMFVRAVPRRRKGGSVRVPRPIVGGVGEKAKSDAGETSQVAEGGHPLTVLYGSNTGTSQAFAQRIASDAHLHGFKAQINTLDSATGRLPTNGPVIIVTASFEGEPADNAAQFVAWLSALQQSETSKSSSLNDIAYTVFGCGNREWVRTYQRIPKLIDEKMNEAGAERLMECGEGDAGSPEFFQKFDEYEERMWGVLEKKYNVTGKAGGADAGLDVELASAGTGRAKVLRQMDAEIGEVLENRLLTKPGAPEKRHIAISLPEGMSYRAGDYLAILPSNPEETVQRAMKRFKLTSDQEITIKASGPTTLPTNAPVSVHSLLSGFVELSQPATTRELQAMKASTTNESVIAKLNKLLENYSDEVLKKRVSMLDLLEQYPEINLSLATFLNLIPPMRIRQYSISSSPLVDARVVSLTVSVIDAPAISGMSNIRFRGVASSFLASLKKGSKVPVVVRPSGAQFALPSDPTTPIVMFCVGSGLAPFRGFVQERAAQKLAGREVGRMMLFVGCRHPEEDYLYMDGDGEMKEWVGMGVIDIRPAFSRCNDKSEGCKYVQHRMWHDRKIITELYDEHAKFYTCGTRQAANGIKEACINIIKDNHPDWNIERSTAAFEHIQKERYAADVFD
ncbi:cytochrome P450 oxidoreductase OrdA-like protein [Fomitiporia mediterranea MF3/22]|uniref:cytochrome P450 oxidoreductase OrdA-like protein n=1 Tax=Fomitiporia mediterranea (strain MF3/22) TaxID=694068 RepID=UPI00044097A1|nr:cytochrome P450 oxidoreductase OrdA-like protein [Fomitiporia mediterranea MF3/22]EJD04651.1 cytochrome P450 oxidoreductase OrdA-like protein [Fomitiporia mediterranea MF3/22]